MKKTLLAGISLAALIAAPAMAADLGVRPAPAYKAAPAPIAVGYNWTGIYIGGNAGGGWGRKCWTFGAFDDGCHNVSGFVGGGQIGVNYQVSQIVFGAEFSGDWANLTGSHVSVGETLSTKVDGILMATGRLGLAWDAALLYVKGGGAWVHDKYSDVFGTFSSTASEWRTGWTIGGGIEYGFAPGWSVAGEYNYIGLGTKTLGFTGTNGTFNEDIKQNISMATIRLNYRFGMGGGAVAARY